MSIEQSIDKLTTAINDLVLQVVGLRTDQAERTGRVQTPASPAPSNADASNPEAKTATTTKPAKPVKAKATPAPAVEPEEAEEATNDSSFLDEEPEQAPAQPELTVETIRQAAIKLQKKLGSEEQVRKILQKQDAVPLASKLKNATQEKFREVLKALAA